MRGKLTQPALKEEAKALYPLYENYSEVARILNLPVTTVKDIIDKDDEFVEVRKQQKRLLIINAHQKAKEVLNEIGAKGAKSMSEAAIVFGTLVDKMAVLSGENSKWAAQTFNIGDNRKLEVNIASEAQSLLKRVKKS